MAEAKFRKLKKFSNYCKNIEAKQKLYQFFGRVYIFDLEEFKVKYNHVVERSQYVVPIDKARLEADAHYKKVLDFQNNILQNPIKNLSDCKKVFEIKYSFKDQYFDENKLGWFVVKENDNVKIVPTVKMVCSTNKLEKYSGSEKIGYLPTVYDFLADKYYTMGVNPLSEDFSHSKAMDDIYKTYLPENNGQVEYFQNITELAKTYPEIDKVDITEIVPPYEDDEYPYWSKEEIKQYATTLEQVIGDEIKNKETKDRKNAVVLK